MGFPEPPNLDGKSLVEQEIGNARGRSRRLLVRFAKARPEVTTRVITEGVLVSMFLHKVKLVMTVAAVVAALAAGAVALAQSGIGRPKDGTAKPIEIAGPSSQNQNAANISGANSSQSENDQEQRKIVLTSPKAMDVAITQRYVCQIHARRHLDVCALENGHLNEIKVREGPAVKKGDLMFKIVPTLNKTKLDADFPNVIAPFDGIIGRLHEKQGSLTKEGDILTTLSDNSVMWVYFNVPEKQYLEYMANRKEYEDKIELVLANQTKFPQPGKLGAIEGQFNNVNENIAFRADFPNPDGLLNHGQAGTILVHRKVHDAIVIPLRTTYEIMNKRYVNVVDKDDVVHRREIVVQHEVDDIVRHKEGSRCGRPDRSRGDSAGSQQREGGIRVSSPSVGPITPHSTHSRRRGRGIRVSSPGRGDAKTEKSRRIASAPGTTRDQNDRRGCSQNIVEKDEEEHHPIPPVSGVDMLRSLIAARQKTKCEVAAGSGLADSTISEIRAGQRKLSVKRGTPRWRRRIEGTVAIPVVHQRNLIVPAALLSGSHNRDLNAVDRRQRVKEAAPFLAAFTTDPELASRGAEVERG